MIGSIASDFTLKNAEGVDIQLSSFKGKWVVLYFYPKDNTSGCTIEAKDFTCLAEEFKKLNCSVIGVSPDKMKSHQNFIVKHDLNIELLSDEEHEVLKMYNAWGLKKMYGKEYEGVIRSTFLIDPDGIVRYEWRKVKVKNHAEKVLDELRAYIDK